MSMCIPVIGPEPIPYSRVAVDVLPYKVLGHAGAGGGLYDAQTLIIVCLATVPVW